MIDVENKTTISERSSGWATADGGDTVGMLTSIHDNDYSNLTV